MAASSWSACRSHRNHQPSRRNRLRSRLGVATRVLLVEDNADTRDMLQAILKLDGFQVEVAADGQQGLDAILAQRPDVALVDIGLPGIDGYEVARRVRQRLSRVRGSPGGTHRLRPSKRPRRRVSGRVR